MSAYDGNPGFTAESFEFLRDARNGKDAWKFLHCSLIVDGMKIRKRMEFDQASKSQVGFVDFGSSFDTDDESLATEAIVVLAVGVHGSWKLALGYFLIRSITATIQAQLLSQVLEQLHEIGVVAVSLTLDGHQTNLATVRKLGCVLTPSAIQHHFPHPSTQRPVFVFLDACHALKLVRNQFCAMQEITVPGRGIARWIHLSELNKFQRQQSLTAANKLSDRHIDFQQQKMKVIYNNVCIHR